MSRYRHDMRGSRVGRWVVAVVAVFGVGCGDEVVETSYTELNRDAFMAACTDGSVDLRLVGDVCECTYDEIETNLALEDLIALEESLKLDSLSPLPESVAEILADCFVAEADL